MNGKAFDPALISKLRVKHIRETIINGEKKCVFCQTGDEDKYGGLVHHASSGKHDDLTEL